MSNNDSNMTQTKTVPTFKVVIVGDCNVGKTCLLKRCIDDSFTSGENATLGSQLYSKKMQARWAPKDKFDDSKSVKSSKSNSSKSNNKNVVPQNLITEDIKL